MPSFDYSTLWEAFASGEGWDQPGIGESTEYGTRTSEFYNQIIGPAFGQEDIQGQGFGDVWEGKMASFDIGTMEQAEEQFRMAIGDPYGRTDDPFSWEKVSRYSAEGGMVSDAQRILEAGLYGQGEYLGGTSGADYATSTTKTKEAYTTGLSGQREGLTYGGLTSGVGLLSGTGGSVLRSGTGEAQAEDVLAETYKKVTSLGEEFTEGKETTELSLKENLDTAFKTYIDAVDDEKERWYGNIMDQVTTLKGIDDTAFTSELEEFAVSQEGWGTGLTFEEEGDYTTFRTDDPDTPDIDESKVCGIGQLFDKASGTCRLIEDLGLSYDEFGNIAHETMGCTDPSATNYNAMAIIDNGTCTGTVVDPPVEPQNCDDGYVWDTQQGVCVLEYFEQCDDDYSWDPQLQQCIWDGGTGMHLTGCNAPGAPPCPEGKECGMNGYCYTPYTGTEYEDLETRKRTGTCPPNQVKNPDGTCTPVGGF